MCLCNGVKEDGEVPTLDQQLCLGVSGGSVRAMGGEGEKPNRTNLLEACLIVTEFPAGVTLKKSSTGRELRCSEKNIEWINMRGRARCVLRDRV